MMELSCFGGVEEPAELAGGLFSTSTCILWIMPLPSALRQIVGK